jgi:hypothetical protein
MQVCFDKLFYAANAGEQPVVGRMHDRFQDLTLGRPEGYSRHGAIAYYECVGRTRVGPYTLDLTTFGGKDEERTQALANMVAVIQELSKVNNPEVQAVAGDLTTLLKEMRAEGARFERDYRLHMGRPLKGD